MKKIGLILMILLFTGCKEVTNNQIDENLNKKIEEQEKIIDTYVDTNSIKIALYNKQNGIYKRVDTFNSKMTPMKDLALFSIILTNEEEVKGGIKNLYNELKNKYENFNNYKIGYNISFLLDDGTVINENILKPKYFTNYTFSNYLYIWLYDDINNSGWYSHIEEDEYFDNTVMTSIKLMPTNEAYRITGPIKLTVFTYDEDDFDNLNNYRGISKFTCLIEKIE